MMNSNTAMIRLILILALIAWSKESGAQAVTRTVNTPQGLAAAVADANVDIIRMEPGDYDMSGIRADEDNALIITRALTIEALDPANPPRIVGGGDNSDFRFASIVVTDTNQDSRTVILADLEFESFRSEDDGGVLRVESSLLVDSTVVITDCVFRGNSTLDSGGALYTTGAFVFMDISDCMFIDNTAMEDAGAVFANVNLIIRDSLFQGNTAESGSAVYAPEIGTVPLTVSGNTFRRNTSTAAGDGAAIVIQGERRTDMERNVFDDNRHFFNSTNHLFVDAEPEGCESRDELGCFNVFADGNTFIHPPGNLREVSIRQESGGVLLTNNVFKNVPDDGFAVVYTSGRLVGLGVTAFGNLFDIDNFTPNRRKVLCRDNAGVGLFESAGFNISEDDSCLLEAEGDQSQTDPMLGEETEDGIVALLPGSPAIDGSLSEFLQAKLACDYKDIRGLGRPQDGNGDGVFECDIGPYEVQGGPDIGDGQSSAYFDITRSGEGVFMELIGNGLAFVAMFTYSPDGQGLAWFVGVGEIVGNSVVVDVVVQTSGGVFGPTFDQDLIVRTEVASMSLNFPTCDATASPGRMSFQARENSGFEDLLVGARRLTQIVPCTGAAPDTSGRSGSFFDLGRDGEGIFVQWLTDGRVLVIWYTYDPEGNQFWTISGDATVDGNTVTANMVYPASGTRFGSQFDPEDVDLQPWGTLTLDYLDCNNISFSYNSTVAGFGQGGYDYTRLTTLQGTTCDI